MASLPVLVTGFIDSILTIWLASIKQTRKIEGGPPMKLHGYFRSSASYRVRIALNLKGLSAEHLAHHLRKGEQRDPSYLAINPQGLVPALEADAGAVLTQSLAIIEWLDETHPKPPLLPTEPLRRAEAPAVARLPSCHPPPPPNLEVPAPPRPPCVSPGQVT